MSAATRVARMLALVPWLLERPGASVAETAEVFGVDRATVLEDLDTIGFCGLPGLGGGDLFEVDIIEDRILVRMADELRRPLRLTPVEALRLVLTGESVAAALDEDLPALRSALERIREAIGLPPTIAVDLDHAADHVLDSVRRAIRERRVLLLHYASRGDATPTERRVAPRTLHVWRGSWYVQGHDAAVDDERTFRLDRVVAVEVLDELADPGGAPLRPPRYEPGPDDVEVEMILGPPARWVGEAVVAEQTEELDGGRLRVRLWTDAPRWVGELVLAGAPHVEVLGPPELAEDVARRARAAAARY
jgi:proteasome accessory factor C